MRYVHNCQVPDTEMDSELSVRLSEMSWSPPDADLPNMCIVYDWFYEVLDYRTYQLGQTSSCCYEDLTNNLSKLAR